MSERDFEKVKEKYDEPVTVKLTRRQALKVLSFVTITAGEWNRLEDEMKKSLGIKEIHHESEDGEEEE